MYYLLLEFCKNVILNTLYLILFPKDSFWKLHCHAVEGAMLTDQCSAVYAYDVATGESLAKRGGSLFIVFGLIIGRVKHRVVHHQIVGIGGG